MAQHEDTDQPQAPDLGAAVQLDNAETLDGEAGGADALDAGYVPPDRPYLLDEDGVTGTGMREGDSLDQRLARETPEDAAPVDVDRTGRLEADDEPSGAVDVGVDGGAASAEEAAVHDVGDDSRVDGEPSVADSPALADPDVERALEEDIADGDAELAGRDAARDEAETDARR